MGNEIWYIIIVAIVVLILITLLTKIFTDTVIKGRFKKLSQDDRERIIKPRTNRATSPRVNIQPEQPRIQELPNATSGIQESGGIGKDSNITRKGLFQRLGISK